jgi:eukaryotic-like serine/threonine-protein kinase
MTPEQTEATQSPGATAADDTLLRPDPRAAYGIQPGTLLVNTYRVERLLGGGGMGEVYLARHAGLGTEHAIKVIRPSMARERQVMELFYREAKVLRGVRHDAVVNYDGFVRDDQGRDYLVMEFVAGQSLSDRLKLGPLTPAEVLGLRDRLCAGLAEAHRQGAVHRDLSPDNVILPGDRIESAKLIDFGLCKLTDPGQESIVGSSFAGKYRYASPEQFGLYGGQVDGRSDIYSLGLILAAAAQGRALTMGESFESALRSRQQVPDLNGVQPVLRDWLAAMLQPDPAQRPANIESLLERWPAATVLAGKGSAAVSGTRAPTRTGPGGRSSVAGAPGGGRWPLVALVSVLIVGAGGGLWWVLRPLPLPEPSRMTPATAIPDRVPDAGPGAPPHTGGPTQPTRPAASGDEIDALIASGRLDDAFALIQSRIAAGQAPPGARTWALIERLRAAGKPDPAFALIRVLAGGGDGRAAFALAELYDPLHWSAASSPFSKPNAEKAREWYGRAVELGVAGAGERLDSLKSAGEGNR